jgi:hypothetical protein
VLLTWRGAWRIGKGHPPAFARLFFFRWQGANFKEGERSLEPLAKQNPGPFLSRAGQP